MDERSANRIDTNEPVERVSGGRTCTALMYNVSTGGCAIESPEADLAPGDPVRLRVKDLPDLDGTIAWQRGPFAGVAFTAPLHSDVVMYLGFKDRAGVSEAELSADRENFARPNDARSIQAQILLP